MTWLDRFKATFRPLLRRGSAEREIAEEFEFHLEQERNKYIAGGMNPEVAARTARLNFGGESRFREEVRDEWSGIVNGLGQDVLHGLRRLCRRPVFALVSLLTLGLGIGANTAVFSLVRSMLFDPLPYLKPDDLVIFWQPSADQAKDTWFSAREVLEYRKATVSFEQIAAYTDFNANLAEGEPERVRGAYVTANMFETLGVSALHGRTLMGHVEAQRHDDVVVLGYGLWQRQFGAARDVVGRRIRVNGQPHTVVGIMTPGFRLPLDFREEHPTELWVPLEIEHSPDMPWGDRSYYIIARLAAGLNSARATTDLKRTLSEWERLGHVNNSDGRLDRAAVPLNELLLRKVRPALWILFAAVGFLLLIACANVAHLFLARSDARRSEIATQAALGASRFRIIRGLLAESGLLAVLAAAFGAVLAYAGVKAALVLAPVNVIRMKGVSLDSGVLGFAILLAFAATIGAALAPALHLSRSDIAGALVTGRGGGASVRRGARRVLIIVETALSLVLVLGAVLLSRSLTELRRLDLGFQTGGVLTLRIDLPRAEYSKPAQAAGFYRELIDRIRQLPRVQSAGAARILPLTGMIGNWSITIENRTTHGEHTQADWQIVTPGYFETLGIRLVQGRTIAKSDNEQAPLVALINETMAARYWPGEPVIGRRFHLGTADQPWIEVVGITRDVRHNGVVEDARTEMYLPHAQWVRAKGGGQQQFGMTLVIRAAGDPMSLLPAVQEQVRRIDSALPVSEVRSLEEVAASALAQPRFTAALLVVFAGLALALAATGLYGVTSFITARRTHEIGIRIALGARPKAVTGLMLRDTLAWTVTGVAAGLLGSLWIARLLSGQLYGVNSLDLYTFAAAPAILLATASVAAYVPACRAARVNPVTALRDE